MNAIGQKKVLLYGARSNPLSYFLHKQLNIKLSARNVFVADTPESKELNRMPTDRKFSCSELSVNHMRNLITLLEENQITNVIDMTNGQLLTDNQEVDVANELPSVNFLSPNFFTQDVPNDSKESKEPPKAKHA